ncbi:MAG: DEAD/DEAH box helicase [Methanosphaera sp. rholeuAM270]|nr:MAG: DEAD/DEAH box helicase [Methanosphaera sp. rholeuAM270]
MIILRRNKKNIELYPIGSAKGALNSQRKPLFYSYFKIQETNGKMRPYRFIIQQDNLETLKSPKEVIKILRKQNVLLATPDEDIESMLNSLNIPFKYADICRHCTFEGNITILKKSSSYKLYKEYICKKCAEKEIKRIMYLRGYDEKSFASFRKLLEKTNDLEKVLQVFDPHFNPIKHDDLTVYDKIKVKDQKYPKIKVGQLKIPKRLKKILSKKVKYLLPVQVLSLKHGLLKNQNLLIVSATASGKTLVGELAGIPKAMNHQKFIYLTPLVALANQKYRDFKKQYNELGLNVAIKVGSNRVKAKGELTITNKSVKNADIIVATYEGLDFLLRSGNYHQLKGVGTVVIDEIHMLGEEERGPRLNGLVKRLLALFPKTQLIGLSATVKNSKQIANDFGMELVEYKQRPVPLERHLIFTKNEYEKKDLLAKLAKKEFDSKSSKGFRGQTIIFTNSRRKTHSIAQQVEKKGITTASYHAGLSYSKKVRIEKDFANQKISTVVTTAALAAGVDFPASQVLFETLRMGNKWLTSNDFSQMLGRAGRPSYHDMGKVYLLPELSKEFDNESEEQKAIELLDSDVDNIIVEYGEDEAIEQVLADISAIKNTNIDELGKKYEKINIPIPFEDIINTLIDKKLIMQHRDNKLIYIPTRYGRATSVSFLDVNRAEYIRKHLKQNPLLIVESIEPFDSAYISNRLASRLTTALKTNVGSRLFSDSTRDIITSGEILSKLDDQFADKLITFQIDFMTCECKERPFCKCLERNVSNKIIKLRLSGWSPNAISRYFMTNYDIHIYPGDIFTWLDAVIRMLEAISRIGLAFNNKNINGLCKKYIKKIEQGK